MIYQKNNYLWFKLNGLLRYLVVHIGCNHPFDYYLVNEYPKSGGSWLAQMLAEIYELPFPRNRLPIMKPSVMHGHYFHSWNVNKAVILWRDGRDILVSQYYHYLFENEIGNKRIVKISRKYLKFNDYRDIRNNLKLFIKYVYQTKKQPRFTWNEFVDKWYGQKHITYAKYEDLRHNTPKELQRITKELTGLKLSKQKAQFISDKYSFERQSKRKTGNENINSFMRKGIIGDWKNFFSKETKELFDYYAGETLIKLGYEKDRSWVKE